MGGIEMFECRKCKAEMDKKTFYGLFYGKDGTRKIVCVRCGSALIITKKMYPKKAERLKSQLKEAKK
jgi:hypothetical protein